MRRRSVESVNPEFHSHLVARRTEIERAVLTRVFAVSDPAEALDPEYAEGLRSAVKAAIDYGLQTVELGEERSPPPPPALLAQARLAARNGVSLDTVLRRYFAGHALIADFLVEEAERSTPLSGVQLQRLLRSQASVFDRVLAAVSEEHVRESQNGRLSSQERSAERIERLLAGEPLDTSQLGYDFDAHHLAVIGKGPAAMKAIRELARSLDRRLLATHREEGVVWAWLGGRAVTDPGELERQASATLPAQVSLAIGEPAKGLGGWRLSHQQARAALPIALRSPEPVIRYGEVALLAAILQDDLLATSLHELYLAPLERGRDGGEVARETLRAYFASGLNISATAAALKVSRQAVTNRLRAIEETFGRPLGVCSTELEIALQLDAHTDPHSLDLLSESEADNLSRYPSAGLAN
jgi:hypothetical protein